MEIINPLVSFIIPCFNQAGFLYESICSVMCSYSGPKEIFVIDDCSTEPSTSKIFNEIITNFPSVKLIYQNNNKGLSATRNYGISLSTGDYIQFLDADDCLLPGKVDYQIEHFKFGNNIEISITDYIYSNKSLSEFTIPEPCIGSFNLTLDDFLYKWERGLSIPIHCALFKRNVFTDNLFDESLTAKEDWVFWCKQAISKKKSAFLNINGAVYRLHAAAMTKRKQSEMGQMWVKASTIINDLIKKSDNSFINSSIAWYDSIYKMSIDSPDNTALENDIGGNDMQEIVKNFSIPNFISKTKLGRKKTFSIIVPVYNHFEYLNKCFMSIISQNCIDYEIICIDDNSTDARVIEYLKSLELNLPNIKVLYNRQNMGISSAFNQGINVADGRFIAFLDCDDYLASTALEEVNKNIHQFPDIDYYFTDKVDIDENDKFIREAIYGGYASIHPSGDIEDDLLDGMVASHLKVIRKEKIIEVGGFNTSLDGVQDYDLALKILGRGIFKYINKPLYYHRQHTLSITNKQTASQFRKMNIARRNYCERVYKKKSDPSQGISYFKECVNSGIECSLGKLSEYGILLFNAENITVPRLKDEMKKGNTCILDARVDYQPDLKYFLREYNSYLDFILTDNSQLAISILGVLWEYKLLWKPLFQ